MKKRSGRISVSVHSSRECRTLYPAALFEADLDKIPRRIDLAEKAILARVKELFSAKNDHIDEDLVLDDALHALRALRKCVTTQGNAA